MDSSWTADQGRTRVGMDSGWRRDRQALGYSGRVRSQARAGGSWVRGLWTPLGALQGLGAGRPPCPSAA